MSHFDAASAIAAQCLCFRARRTARVLTRLYDEALRPLGIQATQLTILSAVGMSERVEAPLGLVAETLAMDPATLSRNLRPLERDGLVRLEPSTKDKRVRTAKLTDLGRETLGKALPLWEQAHSEVVRSIGDEAAKDLHQRLDATAAANRR